MHTVLPPSTLPQGLEPDANNPVSPFLIHEICSLALAGMTSSEKRQAAGEEMWPWGRGAEEAGGCTGTCLGLVNSFGIGSGKT